MTEFEKIYQEHFDDVFLFIRKMSHDEKLAEDITSETFFKALNSLDKFNGTCDVRVWLCQIAKNCYISHLRKTGKTIPIEELENVLESRELNIEELITNSEVATQIHKLLHALSEPYKEVFSLRVFAEMNFKQIGELFGKTDNWACVTFHRAKSQIRKVMEDTK